MVGRVSEIARATQWACAAASTVATDRILMLLMILKTADMRKRGKRKRI
jgi:hypothetical protein